MDKDKSKKICSTIIGARAIIASVSIVGVTYGSMSIGSWSF